MKLIVTVSHGTNDPTRASLGIIAAKIAVEQGHEVVVWLQGEGVTIANRNVYKTILGINTPPLKDALEFLIGKKTPLWVCEACAKGRNVGPDNWVETATYKGMGDYVRAVTSMDKNIDF